MNSQVLTQRDSSVTDVVAKQTIDVTAKVIPDAQQNVDIFAMFKDLATPIVMVYNPDELWSLVAASWARELVASATNNVVAASIVELRPITGYSAAPKNKQTVVWLGVEPTEAIFRTKRSDKSADVLIDSGTYLSVDRIFDAAMEGVRAADPVVISDRVNKLNPNGVYVGPILATIATVIGRTNLSAALIDGGVEESINTLSDYYTTFIDGSLRRDRAIFQYANNDFDVDVDEKLVTHKERKAALDMVTHSAALYGFRAMDDLKRCPSLGANLSNIEKVYKNVSEYILNVMREDSSDDMVYIPGETEPVEVTIMTLPNYFWIAQRILKLTGRKYMNNTMTLNGIHTTTNIAGKLPVLKARDGRTRSSTSRSISAK